MRKFDIGDKVRLISGGPVMTVKKYKSVFSMDSSKGESETDVVCTWFSQGSKHEATYHQDTLEFVD